MSTEVGSKALSDNVAIKDELAKDVDAIWHGDTNQTLFRHLLDAMSRPGKLFSCGHLLNGSPLYKAVLATLVDAEVSVCDLDKLLDESDWPLLQSKCAEANEADFILADGTQPMSISPRIGTLASPDYSSTIILCLPELKDATNKIIGRNKVDGDFIKKEMICRLAGPGIPSSNLSDSKQEIHFPNLHKSWLDFRNQLFTAFPLGVDYLILDSVSLTALPRTTQLEILL